MAPLKLVVIITSLILQSRAFSSVLDLPDCRRGHITEDVELSTDDMKITNRNHSRTLIECLGGCWLQIPFNCSSVVRDDQGTCYHLNGGSLSDLLLGHTHQQESSSHNFDNSTIHGDFMEFVQKGNVTNCYGRACSSGEICLRGCNGESLSHPVCVADQSDCELTSEVKNIRHYWSTAIVETMDSGTVMSLTYPKLYDTTAIRVIMHMAVGNPGNDTCSKWFFTFNGVVCTDPASIEMSDYRSGVGQHHQAMDLDGICNYIPKGNIKINLQVDGCDGFTNNGTVSGWKSARTLVVMEIDSTNSLANISHSEQANNHCKLLNSFNYFSEAWFGDTSMTTDLGNESVLLKTVNYTKWSDSTTLRIKYSAVSGVEVLDPTLYYCARWFVTVNDVECNVPVDFIIHQWLPNHYLYWNKHFRTRTAEGLCEGDFSAGTYEIKVWVGRCRLLQSQPTKIVIGEDNSASRLHVVELQTQHPIDGLQTKSEMFRNHMGQIASHPYNELRADADQGYVVSFTYTKMYRDTALRLTATGDHRIQYDANMGNSQCGRWYFLIDYSECRNPGSIEGISYFEHFSNVHNPMQVSGICHGISLGNRRIHYMVGVCDGYSATNAYTGWESSFHVIVEELRVEEVRECSGIPVTC